MPEKEKPIRETAEEAAAKEARGIVDKALIRTAGKYYAQEITHHGDGDSIFGIRLQGDPATGIPLDIIDVEYSTTFPERLFEVTAVVAPPKNGDGNNTIVIGRYRDFVTADMIVSIFEHCDPSGFEQALIFADKVEKSERSEAAEADR